MDHKIILKILFFVTSLPGFDAAADTLKGKEIYARTCSACHSINVHRIGPYHKGVFGRKAGTLDDYDYSPALKKSKITWNDKTLIKWLKNPNEFVPNSKMGFSLQSDEDIIHIIDFLRSL